MEISYKLISSSECYYRPQRSCGKVMFSQVCVKNSVHGGWGVCVPACTTGHITRGGGLCPGGVLSRAGPCPGGSLSRRGSLSGGSLSRGVSVRETPHTVASGWYASYWNAFLFIIQLIRNLFTHSFFF